VDVFTGATSASSRPDGQGAPVACPDVRQATELLRAAKRPVVIAGSGVWWSGAEQALREFVERTQIPLYTITMARGTVPDDHPLSMGYADPALNYAVHTVFREADLFLVAGSGSITGLHWAVRDYFRQRRSLFRSTFTRGIGMNRALDAAICGDAGGAGCDSGRRAARPGWWNGCGSCARRPRRGWRRPCGGGVFPRDARGAASRRAFLLGRRGFRVLGRAFLPARHAGGWLRLGRWGPSDRRCLNAISLQLAHPGRKVVAVTGDGAGILPGGDGYRRRDSSCRSY
jgi:acetolactate synthase-1/2/3 large subunit